MPTYTAACLHSHASIYMDSLLRPIESGCYLLSWWWEVGDRKEEIQGHFYSQVELGSAAPWEWHRKPSWYIRNSKAGRDFRK